MYSTAVVVLYSRWMRLSMKPSAWITSSVTHFNRYACFKLSEVLRGEMRCGVATVPKTCEEWGCSTKNNRDNELCFCCWYQWQAGVFLCRPTAHCGRNSAALTGGISSPTRHFHGPTGWKISGWVERIYVEHRLAIAVWPLATNVEYRTIGHLFGVSRSNVWTIVNKVYTSTVTKLMHRFIRLPAGDKLDEVVTGFRNRCFRSAEVLWTVPTFLPSQQWNTTQTTTTERDGIIYWCKTWLTMHIYLQMCILAGLDVCMMIGYT